MVIISRTEKSVINYNRIVVLYVSIYYIRLWRNVYPYIYTVKSNIRLREAWFNLNGLIKWLLSIFDVE